MQMYKYGLNIYRKKGKRRFVEYRLFYVGQTNINIQLAMQAMFNDIQLHASDMQLNPATIVAYLQNELTARIPNWRETCDFGITLPHPTDASCELDLMFTPKPD